MIFSETLKRSTIYILRSMILPTSLKVSAVSAMIYKRIRISEKNNKTIIEKQYIMNVTVITGGRKCRS